MSEAIVYCIRGCTRKRAHVSDCEDRETCRGCEPRLAKHGLLCWPCHRRFAMMLAQAEIADRWLTGNLPSGEKAAATRQDYEQRHSTSEAEAPLHLAILDARTNLRDRLASWAEDLCEAKGLTGPKHHDVLADSMFLHTWLTTIEHLAWIGDWFEELAETMSDAHAVAPWRPELQRLRGTPCPECHAAALVIFGGEEDVTCLECRTQIPSRRYGIWTRILLEEARQGA